MEKMYPVFDEEDDLYSGFNEFHPTLNTSNLLQDQAPRETKLLQVPIPVSALAFFAVVHSKWLTVFSFSYCRLADPYWRPEEAFQRLLLVLLQLFEVQDIHPAKLPPPSKSMTH